VLFTKTNPTVSAKRGSSLACKLWLKAIGALKEPSRAKLMQMTPRCSLSWQGYRIFWWLPWGSWGGKKGFGWLVAPQVATKLTARLVGSVWSGASPLSFWICNNMRTRQFAFPLANGIVFQPSGLPLLSKTQNPLAQSLLGPNICSSSLGRISFHFVCIFLPGTDL